MIQPNLDLPKFRAAALTELGRRMFFDPRLSASGKQACATCHDPAHAFGPPSALPVQSRLDPSSGADYLPDIAGTKRARAA